MRTISPGVAQRCAPTGFSRVRVAAISGLSVRGSAPIPASPPAPRPPPPPRLPRVLDSGRPQLAGVERGALEEVGELLAVGAVVERDLLVPGKARGGIAP